MFKKDQFNYSDLILEKDYRKSWKYFLKLYKDHISWTITISIIALIAAAITIAIPFLTQFINEATNNKNLLTFISMAISTFIIYLLKIILDFLNEFLGNHFNYKLEIEWRKILIEKVHKMKLDDFENRSVGDFIARIVNDLKDILTFAFQFLTNIIYVSTILIGGFIYIFWVNWLVGLIPLFVILVAIIIYLLCVKKFVITRHYTKSLNAKVIQKTEENLQSIYEIKSFAINNLMIKHYSKTQNRYLEKNRKSNLQLAFYKMIGVSTNVLTTSLILVIASYNVMTQQITNEQLIGLTSASSLLVIPLTNLSIIFIDIVKISPTLSRLNSWMNLDEEEDKGELNNEILGKIEFKNVSFSYKLDNNKKINVLNNFNMIIQPGEYINIYGLSGSGKSTIFKLILRFYDIDQGEILIDDKPINEYSLSYLRSIISYIPTNSKPFFEGFDASLFDNNEEFYTILKKLGIQDIYLKKRANDQSSNGVACCSRLSSGEIQILSFARAIYFNSKIILLDSIENSLDDDQIRKINIYLQELKNKRTIIIGTSNNNNSFNAIKQYNI